MLTELQSPEDRTGTRANEDLACPRLRWPPLHAAAQAGPCCGGLRLAKRPDFNDPLVRSLPIASLAIAMAMMEDGMPNRT